MRVLSGFESKGLSLVLAAGLAGLANPASAVTAVNSHAYGLLANLNVANIVNATVGPLSATGGSAPADYTGSATLASINTDVALGTSAGAAFSQHLGTGLLTSSASGSAGTPSATATSTVNNLGTGLTSQVAFLPGVTIAGLGATTLTSTSSVGLAGGNLFANGSSSIEGLTLAGTALGGLVIDGSLYGNAAPNTVILDLLGFKIIANEQLFGGDGVTSKSITTNALDLKFTNFLLGTNLLNGSIVIAHSDAAISGFTSGVVPEPQSWAMLIAGFGLTGAVVRRRRSSRSVAA